MRICFLFPFLLALNFLIFGTSCRSTSEPPEIVEVGPDGEEAPPTPSPARARAIGAIEAVYPKDRFCLVRRSGANTPEEGARLLADGPGPLSQLVATDHRNGVFFSAKIEEGEPQVGDSVRLFVKPEAVDASENLTLPDPKEWMARGRSENSQQQQPPSQARGDLRVGLPDEWETLSEISRGPFSGLADEGGRVMVEQPARPRTPFGGREGSSFPSFPSFPNEPSNESNGLGGLPTLRLPSGSPAFSPEPVGSAPRIPSEVNIPDFGTVNDGLPALQPPPSGR